MKCPECGQSIPDPAPGSQGWQVLYALRVCPTSARNVAALTGLTPKQVTDQLRRLRHAGHTLIALDNQGAPLRNSSGKLHKITPAGQAVLRAGR